MKLRSLGVLIALLGPAAAFAQLPVPTTGLDTAGFDRSVRPQDDFYSFVNGGWIARASIPADRGSLAYVDLETRIASALRRLVEAAASTRGPSGSATRLLGDYYASLVDSVALDKAGATPLQPLLRKVRRLRDFRDLPEMFATLGLSSVRTPMLVNVLQDPKASDTYALTLMQWGLGLPARAMYLRTDSAGARLRRQYEQHIRAMLTLAGVPGASEAAASVLRVETRLARAQWDPVKNRDPVATYNKLTLARQPLTQSCRRRRSRNGRATCSFMSYLPRQRRIL